MAEAWLHLNRDFKCGTSSAASLVADNRPTACTALTHSSHHPSSQAACGEGGGGARPTLQMRKQRLTQKFREDGGGTLSLLLLHGPAPAPRAPAPAGSGGAGLGGHLGEGDRGRKTLSPWNIASPHLLMQELPFPEGQSFFLSSAPSTYVLTQE